MKRDQCLHSCRRISAHDARVVAEFRERLRLLARLEREGHTRECARLQALDDQARSCSCAAEAGK